ncbi:zinc ribbon domain-containing protein [Ectobacillus ponti]|uniref:Zinc ribbon domain-containing protein n=1 Tax=Ectobacillus ponti TaxID=2961894 RepID=A0AA41XDR5_9BACI|nr:zinc ribbon domain-containing protein [Ectobacillus ponti]MCP8971040.1 zinc ribbon domain-containing protein [Ectobacillus ponti]
MHCRACGTAAYSSGPYCISCGADGFLYHTGARFLAQVFPFCKACGTHNEKGSNHCMNCGEALAHYSIGVAPAHAESVPQAAESSGRQLEIEIRLQSLLLPFAAAFGGLLLFFFALSLYIKGKASDALAGVLGGTMDLLPGFGQMGESAKGLFAALLGTANLFLQSLGTSFRFGTKLGEQSYALDMQIPLSVLGVLIAAVFFFVGRAAGRGSRRSWLESAISAVLVGVMFAIGAAVLSFFARETLTVEEVTMSLRVPFWRAFLHAFVIGALFSFAGMLYQQGKSLLELAVKAAWRTHWLLMAFVAVATLIWVFAEDGFAGGSAMMSFLLLLMLALNLCLLVPFGSFHVKTTSMLDGKTFDGTFSLGSLENTNSMYGGLLQADLAGVDAMQSIVLFALAALILYTVWRGYRHPGQMTQMEAVKISAVFGACFAVFSGGWMYLMQSGITAVGGTGKLRELLVWEPSMLRNMLLAFLLLTAAHYAGLCWRLYKSGVRW